MASMEQLTPGARVLCRDAEWLATRKEPVMALGNPWRCHETAEAVSRVTLLKEWIAVEKRTSCVSRIDVVSEAITPYIVSSTAEFR